MNIHNTMINTLKFIFSSERSNFLIEQNRDIIIRLKFIGTFQPNEKVDVRNLRIENNTMITPIKRMLFGESRDTTYSFLNSTIERSFEIINAYIRSDKISEKIYCKNILSDMIKAIQGLKNIQKTYRDDKLFYCNIETVIENIESKLSEIREKYPEIFDIKTIQDEILEREEFFKNEKKEILTEPKLLESEDVNAKARDALENKKESKNKK
jgi:hypothetical protein